MKSRKLAVLAGILAGCSSVSAVAAGNERAVETTSRVFSLHLGASRVIYNPASSGATY